MNITDAFWEYRNLGVKTFEISVSTEDTVENLLKEEQNLIEQGAQYLVLKVPVNMPAFIFGLAQAGYIFIETVCCMSLKKQNYRVPPHIQRLDRDMTVKRIGTDSERQEVFDEISKGMFESDRIAVDPFFNKTQACMRYINWLKDMNEQGCWLYQVIYKDKRIGFFNIKQIDEGKAYPVLGGVYTDYKNKGLGIFLTKKIYDTSWEEGFNTVITFIVSNNIVNIRTNLLYGFEIDTMLYTYIKHI